MRGLIAADHKYWWSYSLYAATLRRLGRLREAVEQLDKGSSTSPRAEVAPDAQRAAAEIPPRATRNATTTIHTPLRKGARHGTHSDLGGLGSITKVLDLGNLVNRRSNSVLPKDMAVVGDVAGASSK